MEINNLQELKNILDEYDNYIGLVLEELKYHGIEDIYIKADKLRNRALEIIESNQKKED